MEGLLSRAAFDEQDAGSGPVHSSPSLGPMTAAIHNISARHLHDIATSLPDDRQFLRSWRKQLQECLTQQNARMVRFLLAGTTDASGGVPPDPTSSELVRRCSDILTKYSRPTWNFASSTRDLSLPTSTDTAAEEVARDLGIAPAALRDIQRRAVRLYVNAATAVCAAEGRLEDRLKRLETVVGRVNDMMFMEPTAELEALAGPAREYLDSVLDKISIEEEYAVMIDAYRRFAVLRGVVASMQFQRQTAPTCTICMAKEVSQVVAPCGHTFCDECCRPQMTSCYICRVQIRDKMRLYFS
jgi:hypothetical protein